MPATTPSALRTDFFDFLFGTKEGYVCICTSLPTEDKAKNQFKQQFFRWPGQKAELASFIDEAARRKNVWFCVNMLSRAERKKEYALHTNLVWSDLDECKPSDIEPRPSVVIQSSQGRWQALWRMEHEVPPDIASDYSKRIAYKYQPMGADISGWDLTQLLRVPFTRNFKYQSQNVELIFAEENLVDNLEFEVITPPTGGENGAGSDDLSSMPNPTKLPSVEQIMYAYTAQIFKTGSVFASIYEQEPDDDADWSKLLWRLLNICIEAGMSREETFVVALNSKVNKYARDNRPLRYLWRDVCKAWEKQEKLTLLTNDFSPLKMPVLVQLDELEKLDKTFVHDYRAWGEQATDAVPQYHDLCAFIALSSLIAGNVRLEASYGTMVPNIWGLILGSSTLTRKTTAMRMVNDLIADVNSDIVLATDGSAEGLLSGLSQRPNQVSMFFKDEVGGFLDSITKKDYLAGMPETLTQLYDVPRIYTRILRKETITLTSPVFIFFGGGIRDKVYQVLQEEHILSGFLPRFLIVAGDADLTKLRRTGPASKVGTIERNNLLTHLQRVAARYSGFVESEVFAQKVTIPLIVEAELTDAAWQRYGDLEMKMVEVANDSHISMVALPTFERMSRSLLKMAVLLAASRQEPKDKKITVETQDILWAAWYIQEWGTYTIDLIVNVGKGAMQRKLDKIFFFIKENPGCTRSRVTQRHHLMKREADEIIGTLEDRGIIRLKKEGRGYTLWAN